MVPLVRQEIGGGRAGDRAAAGLDAPSSARAFTAPGAAEEMKAKVVLAGAPGVGKTSLVRRYVLQEFGDRYLRTLGAIVYKRMVEVEVWPGRVVHVTMTLWDTMGRGDEDDVFRDIDLYNAQGVLAVCDATDARTIAPLHARMQAALRIAGDVPTHILMNKADLGLAGEARNAGLDAGRDRGAPCYLTSAKGGDNVAAAFDELARRIVERQLLPATALDAVDWRLVEASRVRTLTIEDVARTERISPLFAEARLDRLRRNGHVRFAALGLDAQGRPQVSYAKARTAVQAAPLAPTF